MLINLGRLNYTTSLIILIVLAILLGSQLIYWYVADIKRFPINYVKVIASYNHISKQQLEEIVSSYISSYSFFSLPSRQIITNLKNLTWVQDVQVKKIWPDIVNISINEKVPFTRWNDSFLTQDGEIFGNIVDHSDLQLAFLQGPVAEHREILAMYKKLNLLLALQDLQIKSLVKSISASWDLTLKNDIILHLGKKDLVAKIERFCKVYKLILVENPKLQKIDLRYPHGLAVS